MAFSVQVMICSLLILPFCSQVNALSSNHYDKTCPNVESIVAKTVSDATSNDNTVPAGLLRMHFHDCFVRVSMTITLSSDMYKKTVFAILFCMHNLELTFDLIMLNFEKGCDGSVLLESRGGNTAEKGATSSLSLHAFYVIEGAKKAVEAVCPGIVSCADILAFAARDAVVLV